MAKRIIGSKEFPQGSAKKTSHPELPFVTTTTTRRGRVIGRDHFDISSTDYMGSEGLYAFRDLMGFSQTKGRDANITIRETIIAASKETNVDKWSPKTSQAYSFLNQIAAMIAFAAKNSDWKTFINALIVESEIMRIRVEAEKTAANIATGKRLAAAKAAKRALGKAKPCQA